MALTFNDSTENLSNKNLFSTNVNFVDSTDNTKKFSWDLSNLSTNTTVTFASSATVNRTYTFPNLTDTITTSTATQTLTNKTLTTPTIATINNGTASMTLASDLNSTSMLRISPSDSVVTLGSSLSTAGPLFARSSNATAYFSNGAGAGDMIIRNTVGSLLIGTGTAAQITMANSGGVPSFTSGLSSNSSITVVDANSNPDEFLSRNSVKNRKTVLYDGNTNNDHQYYGFGINNGVLRYQLATTTADHVFYAGTGTSSSNELMRIKGTGGFQLPTTGGTPSSLNYYEEITQSVNYSGIWAAPYPGTLYITRIGKVVTITGTYAASASNSSGTVTLDYVLPSRLRPNTVDILSNLVNLYTPIFVLSGGFQLGIVLISATSGSFTFYGSTSLGNFPASVSATGPHTWNVTYKLA